ncbi:MAG TPA: hypothetical protein VNW92_30235 [Polyangiaceae bacterium]|jgi:hypothetical protein|nr:hypothetical protein [Polyangiaceae bacterium]
MTRLVPVLVLVLLATACGSSDAGGSSLNTAEKMGALTAADLPLLCDAWAADVGGYGSPPVTKDCGNAMSTSRAPTSQADCVTSFQQQKPDATCMATVANYLDCKKALYANPCATVGEAPTCTVFLTSSACSAP